MLKDNSGAKMEIVGDQYIIENSGSSLTSFAKVSWFEKPAKYEIRKWSIIGDSMVPGKGVSFKNKASVDRLAETLVELGFGNTEIINQHIASREDYAAEESTEEEKEKTYSSQEVLDNIL